MDINVVKKVSSYYDVASQKITKSNNILTYSNGSNDLSRGFIGVLLAIAKNDSAHNLQINNLKHKAEIMQWLEYCALHVFSAANSKSELNILKELDQTLRTRSYLLGDFLSLADIVMFYSIQSLMPLINSSHRLLHVVRWYDHLQKNDSISRGNILINFNYLFI